MESETPPPGARPTMDPLTTSPRIDKIAAALAKAQAKIDGAKKGSENPFFRSRYADLASVWDACREALTENAISVVQVPNGDGEAVDLLIIDEDKNGNVTGSHSEKGARVRLTSLLLHESGQWIGGTSTMTAANMGPQSAGACLTYLRRYSLAALVGVAPEDDDGNVANGRSGKGGPVQRATDGRRADQADYDRARLDSEMAAEPGTTVEVVDSKSGVVTKQPRVSADQLTEIGDLAHQGRYTPEQLRKLVKEKFGAAGPEDLGRGQAIDLIRRLHSKVDAAKGAAGAVRGFADPGSAG